MIRFLIALFILCVCMLIGYCLRTFQATVSIDMMGYTAQTNLLIWLIVSIIFSLLVLWLCKILRFIWKTPERFSHNRQTRKRHKAERLLKSGLNDLIAGHYKRAEKQLVKGGELSEQLGHSPLLYFENAAIAADRQQADRRRDDYLLRARVGADNQSRKITRLAEAEILVKNGQYAQAEKLLEAAKNDGGENPGIFMLLDTIYPALDKWSDAWENLGQMRAFLSWQAFDERRKRYACGMLRDTAAINTYTELRGAWQKLPPQIRDDKEMIILYAGSLVENGHGEEAEQLLGGKIKGTGDLDYIQAYSQLQGINYRKALHNMALWADRHGDDPIFLYCRARLAFRAEEYTLADEYIEHSIKRRGSAEAFALWGQILEARDQPQAALAAYRQSLLEKTGGAPVEGELLRASTQKSLPS